MKLRVAAILMMVTLGAFSPSPAAQIQADIKKSQEEMEIMRGILNTTLTFFVENSQKRSLRGRSPKINSFYLAGQGAVFEIPTAGLSGSSTEFGPNWDLYSSDLFLNMGQEIALRTQEAQVEAMEAAKEAVGISSPAASSAAPVVTDKSGKTAKAQTKLEDARKRMDELKTKLEKRKEEQAEKHQKFLQILSDVRTPLVDALANYGDSLTTVKPEEYVNLVLVTEENNSYSRRVDVISARKSWIADYKAGRLTLDAFRQKVLQYNQ